MQNQLRNLILRSKIWFRPPLDTYWPLVDHKTPKMDLTSKEPNLNMPNRVFGLTEAEFLVKNALSTTPGHLLTTGRPQNARKHTNTYPKHKIQKHDH